MAARSRFVPVLVLLTVGTAACSDTPTADSDAPPSAVRGPSLDHASTADSSAIESATSTAAAASPASLVLPSEAALTITVQERNAAWWHLLKIVSPETRVLFGPGYLFPSEGPFEVGPYPAGTVEIGLDAYNPREPHEFFRTASAMVEGSYPSWTVRFEDGLDNDFNDIIIRVEAAAPLCPAPYFGDEGFQNQLAIMWDLSFPDEAPIRQRERFGWIVEEADGFRLEPVIVLSDACQILGSEIYGDIPAGAVGWVHTHPSGEGDILLPGDCESIAAGFGTRFGTGPSTGDLETHRYYEERLGRDLTGIILEPDRVYEFDSQNQAGTPYPACTFR